MPEHTLTNPPEPREGIHTVYDHEGRYVGCVGRQTFQTMKESRTGTVGGDGSHWDGCWEHHIDCAGEYIAHLRSKVSEFAQMAGALELGPDHA